MRSLLSWWNFHRQSDPYGNGNRASPRISPSFLRRFRLWLVALLTLGMIVGAGVMDVRAAVTLLYFRIAQGTAGNSVEWATTSEINNSGFYVQRRQPPATEFTRITDLIPSTSVGSAGATYTYTDGLVQDGQTYVYMLEMLDTNGVSDFSEPITVTYGVITATPTSTPTHTETGTGPTSTGTPTPTGTLKTPTPSRTATRTPTSAQQNTTPTRTATSSFPTTTLRVTGTRRVTGTTTITQTPTITITPTWTATFLPLPKITLLFPVLSPTGTSTPTLTITPTPSLPPVAGTAGKTFTGPNLVILGGVIILLWVLLSGFLIVYLRRLGY